MLFALYATDMMTVNSAPARPNAGQVRILVADDHEVMRMGIRNLLESIPDWAVAAEASTGREAVDLALRTSPDIIIMDITMPEMNGFEAAAEIARERPEIPVIMFSLHLSEDVLTRFKPGPIRGAVSKSEAARDLLDAVRAVLNGGTFFPMRSSSVSAP
jgi:DNA-binding NarL/FixJ family response regulator